MTSTDDDNVIQMHTNDSPITLSSSKVISYYATTKYDAHLLKANNYWHQIIVHHKNKCNKRQILDALFEAVENDDFYPVAYKECELRDTFLIRNCQSAIEKLFKKNLSIRTSTNDVLYLTFKFNVAEYCPGQIYPAKKLDEVIEKQFKQLIKINGISNILNLDMLNSQPEFVDIEMNLGNTAAFALLCKVISQNHEIVNGIDGLKLANNNISSLAPLNSFSSVTFQLLDLSYNKIKEVSQFRHLKEISINTLDITGNPVLQVFDSLRQINNILPDTILKNDSNLHVTKKEIESDEETMVVTKGDIITKASDSKFKKNRDSDKWHQLSIVHNGKYTKDKILESIFYTCDIYPCYYKIGPKEDSFFVRHCTEKLKVFLENDLRIRMIETNEYLKVKLIMNFAEYENGQVDVNTAIKSTIKDRFNKIERVLNLENFSTAKNFLNIEISLSNSKILSNVLLICSQRYGENVIELRLGYNNITCEKKFHNLKEMKCLKVLDLSYNNIKSVKYLENIPHIRIKDLRLNGNPLCANYTLSTHYLKDVQKYFPELITLDGVAISKDLDQHMVPQKNFLCTIQAYDCVEQFINSFFTIYDSPNRVKLVDMYSENAVLSLSFHYDTTKVNSFNQMKINKYVLRSRNIRKLTNFGRAYTSMHIGKEDISVIFKYLAKTKHDIFSFTTDVTHFDENAIHITITGVFKEPAVDVFENDLILAFSRTFILHVKGVNLGITKKSTEYKIVNEIYYISNPTSVQSKSSFKYSDFEDKYDITAANSEDKECFAVMFQEMTGLKTIWCTRFLEDASWNIREGLHIFLNKKITGLIPENAFIEK